MRTTKQRNKPVVGSQVSKALLRCLRELRDQDMRFNEPSAVESRGFINHDSEEIEMWETMIRSLAMDWRSLCRDHVFLDRETAHALDSATGSPSTDAGKEHRQTFALRAIKAVCLAYTAAEHNGKHFKDLAVDLREKTPDERFAEWLIMREHAQGYQV